MLSGFRLGLDDRPGGPPVAFELHRAVQCEPLPSLAALEGTLLPPELVLSLLASEANRWRLSRVKSKDVNPGRLVVMGKGQTEPIASNDTDAGRRANRRVEILVEPVVAQ